MFALFQSFIWPHEPHSAELQFVHKRSISHFLHLSVKLIHLIKRLSRNHSNFLFRAQNASNSQNAAHPLPSLYFCLFKMINKILWMLSWLLSVVSDVIADLLVVVFATSARSPELWLPIGPKWLTGEMQILVKKVMPRKNTKVVGLNRGASKTFFPMKSLLKYLTDNLAVDFVRQTCVRYGISGGYQTRTWTRPLLWLPWKDTWTNSRPILQCPMDGAVFVVMVV